MHAVIRPESSRRQRGRGIGEGADSGSKSTGRDHATNLGEDTQDAAEVTSSELPSERFRMTVVWTDPYCGSVREATLNARSSAVGEAGAKSLRPHAATKTAVTRMNVRLNGKWLQKGSWKGVRSAPPAAWSPAHGSRAQGWTSSVEPTGTRPRLWSSLGSTPPPRAGDRLSPAPAHGHTRRRRVQRVVSPPSFAPSLPFWRSRRPAGRR